MKGFKDSSGKFHPITDYKGVRKSRDQKTKEKGIRLARSSKLSEKQAKNFWNRLTPRSKFDVLTLELDLFLGNIPEHNEGKSFFDRSFDELPIKYQNLVRSRTLKQLKRFTGLKGTPVQAFSPLSVKVERKARSFKPILDEDGDIDVDNEKNQERLEEIIEEETARREEKLIENEDAYEELLNSGTDDVTAMGITVGAGTFLREHDPIAFRESLLDYADGTRPEIEQEVRDEIDEEDSLEGNRFLTLSILSPEQRFSQ